MDIESLGTQKGSGGQTDLPKAYNTYFQIQYRHFLTLVNFDVCVTVVTNNPTLLAFDAYTPLVSEKKPSSSYACIIEVTV